MERIEYRGVVNKGDWRPGPWNDEPDKIQWQDEATGLPCLIVRGPVGALCGYVGVPQGHPLHGLDYGSCPLGDKCPQRTEEHSWCAHTPESSLLVHGGVTFASGCSEISEAKFQKFRERLNAREDEARRFPRGDAAEFLKEWAGIDTYEAWAKRCHSRFICHIPGSDEPDNIWWFGFDCAHAGDICPKMSSYGIRSLPGFDGEKYRDVSYVTNQCAELARQLADQRVGVT